MNKKVLNQLVVLVSLAGSFSVSAGPSAELGIEARVFSEKGFYDQEAADFSIRGEFEHTQQVGDGDAELILFARYDDEDKNRSHADVREAAWTYVGDEWSARVGVSKVFWGVTESAHIVDVVNQTDSVENLDGEDKLGQPMTKLSLEKDWGTLDFFWLPYFRERTYSDIEGRLALPIQVDVDNAQYESSADEWHSDFALRYAHYIDNLDFALSYFAGTSRSPHLQFNNDFVNPRLTPVYNQVEQLGLELQYIYDSWIFKFEGITNSGPTNRRYSSAAAGFEYTQVGIFDSDADLGWLLEYLYDDRKSDVNIVFERDVFAGWRYAFNDADSSEILFGVIVDPETEEQSYSFEASQRISNDIKVNVQARVFSGGEEPQSDLPSVLAALSAIDGKNKSGFFQDEDYLQLELVKYF